MEVNDSYPMVIPEHGHSLFWPAVKSHKVLYAKYHFMISIILSLQATDRAILQVKKELQAHCSSLFPLYSDTQRFALILYEVYVCRAFCLFSLSLAGDVSMSENT